MTLKTLPTRPWDLNLSAPIETPTGTLRTLKDAANWVFATVWDEGHKRPDWQNVMRLILKATNECSEEAIAEATERLQHAVERRYRTASPPS